MRVLLVSHDFLPNHPAGTEIHTADLAAGLRARGVDVELFTTEKDITRRHLSVERREWDGLPVHELVNNLFYGDFRETWDWRPAEEAFGRLLDAFRPDIVHVQHLLYLSVGCVTEAARRGVPVLYTLHDFWLMCPRFGQLIHADGSICHTLDFDRCGTCLARTKLAQTPLERRSARAIAAVRSVTGVNVEPAVRRAERLLRSPARDSAPSDGRVPELAPEPERAAAARLRSDTIRSVVSESVQRFFSPSRFLRARFIEWGIDPERIEHVPNGIDLERFRRVERAPAADGRVRVAFLGTLAPHKAPHLVLDAWERLAPELRARGSVSILGPGKHFPEYVAKLEARASELGARMGGALARDEVPAAFAEIDVLVVPSTWYENAPLTLLEARAARTAVLASDLGGMAEMVVPEHSGWLFEVGDADALARELERILADPSVLETLDFVGDPVPDVDGYAGEMLARYERELAEAAR